MESTCCAEGTIYDEETAFCLPANILPQGGGDDNGDLSLAPEYENKIGEVEIGDGSLGSVCLNNEDCDSAYCNYGMWSTDSGLCTCNPSNNAGCEGDYKCFPDLNMIGIADADPTCYLDFGAKCRQTSRRSGIRHWCVRRIPNL